MKTPRKHLLNYIWLFLVLFFLISRQINAGENARTATREQASAIIPIDDHLPIILTDSLDRYREDIMRRFGGMIGFNEHGFITGARSALLDSGLTSQDPVERTYQLFELRGNWFNVQNPRTEFVVSSRALDADGYGGVALTQSVNGIPVKGAGFFLRFEPPGAIMEITGEIAPEARNVNTAPSISEEQAIAIVFSHERVRDQNPTIVRKEMYIGKFGETFRLAYTIGIESDNGAWSFTIDAHSGEIIQFGPGYIID